MTNFRRAPLLKPASCAAHMAALLLLSAGWSAESTAVSSQSTIDIKLTVLAPPPCNINHGDALEIDFGDIQIDQINGSNYQKSLYTVISCFGVPESNQLKLTLVGEQDPNAGIKALKTSMPGLGILIKNNGTILAMNSSINFTYPKNFILSFAPVMTLDGKMTTGAATASATLKLEYQ